MRRPAIISAILVTILALAFALNVIAQSPGGKKDPPRDERASRGGGRMHRKFVDPQESKEWLEELRKYRSEAEELGRKIDEVQDEMRGLFDKLREATSDEKRKEIGESIQGKVKELNELELEMARKQFEFSDKSFKLALDRLVAAKVELEETERRIKWRKVMTERMGDGKRPFMGPNGPRHDGEHPNGPPEEGPPDREPPIDRAPEE